MSSYRIITREADGSEGHSSFMTRDRAIAFAHAHLKAEIAVVRIESADEVLDEDEVKALCGPEPKSAR